MHEGPNASARTLLSGRAGAPQASWSPGLPHYPPAAATIPPAAAPPVWTAGAARPCLGSLQDHHIPSHMIINCRRAPGSISSATRHVGAAREETVKWQLQCQVMMSNWYFNSRITNVTLFPLSTQRFEQMNQQIKRSHALLQKNNRQVCACCSYQHNTAPTINQRVSVILLI